MSQAARETLRRLDGILAENAQPLRSVLGNLDTFSGALARNSDRMDGIVAGLERMTGGAAAKARLVSYDLTALHAAEATARPVPLQLVVTDPTALAALDSERIQTVSANGAYASVPDAQWSDALPKLLQVKIIRSLEDAGRFAGISRPLEGVPATSSSSWTSASSRSCPVSRRRSNSDARSWAPTAGSSQHASSGRQ
jgi:phospholipid/cholesterol/gamma-HCH transport system substrate-binding protein